MRVQTIVSRRLEPRSPLPRTSRRLIRTGLLVVAFGTVVALVAMQREWIAESWHLTQFQSNDPDVRTRAAASLVRLGSARAVPLFLEHPDREEADAWLRDVAERFDDARWGQLAGVLASEDAQLSIDAVFRALGDHRKELLRRRTPEIVLRSKDRESSTLNLTPYFERLRSHPNADVRRWAIEIAGPESSGTDLSLRPASALEAELAALCMGEGVVLATALPSNGGQYQHHVERALAGPFLSGSTLSSLEAAMPESEKALLALRHVSSSSALRVECEYRYHGDRVHSVATSRRREVTTYDRAEFEAALTKAATAAARIMWLARQKDHPSRVALADALGPRVSFAQPESQILMARQFEAKVIGHLYWSANFDAATEAIARVWSAYPEFCQLRPPKARTSSDGSTVTVDQLAFASDSRNPVHQRTAVIWSLRRMRDVRSQDVLELSNDPHPEIRAAVNWFAAARLWPLYRTPSDPANKDLFERRSRTANGTILWGEGELREHGVTRVKPGTSTAVRSEVLAALVQEGNGSARLEVNWTVAPIVQREPVETVAVLLAPEGEEANKREPLVLEATDFEELRSWRGGSMGRYKLDLSSVSPGMYRVRLRAEGIESVERALGLGK